MMPWKLTGGFPLVQLPKKFRACGYVGHRLLDAFPLVQLPKKFREYFFQYNENSLYLGFPLVQLPKKFRV